MSMFGNKQRREPPHVATFEKGAKVTATFDTSMGTFVARLFSDECPMTVGNFVGLATGETPWTDPKTGETVKRPLYDGTVFHRVIPEFMIQGGDPEGRGTGGPGYRFDDEIVRTLEHDRPGILSMANAGPGTNGSQFFVTEVATPWLNGKHTVFGEVIEGIELISKITHTPRGPGDKPLEPVVLKKLSITVQ